MTEHDLRSLIRGAVLKALAARGIGGSCAPHGAGEFSGTGQTPGADGSSLHASHAVYVTVVNAGDACVIEPAVVCNHCGYCRTHGY
jgi:hypothetical protein